MGKRKSNKSGKRKRDTENNKQNKKIQKQSNQNNENNENYHQNNIQQKEKQVQISEINESEIYSRQKTALTEEGDERMRKSFVLFTGRFDGFMAQQINNVILAGINF